MSNKKPIHKDVMRNQKSSRITSSETQRVSGEKNKKFKIFEYMDIKSMSIGSYFEFPRHQCKVIDKIYTRLEHKLSMNKENYHHSTLPKILILIVYIISSTLATYIKTKTYSMTKNTACIP